MQNGFGKSSSNSNSIPPFNRSNLRRGLTLSGRGNITDSPTNKLEVSFDELIDCEPSDDWERLQAEYDAQFDDASSDEYDCYEQSTQELSDTEQFPSGQLSSGVTTSSSLKVSLIFG